MGSPSPLCLSLLVCVAAMFRAAVAQTGLSPADQQTMLDAHNYFRSRVSPTATNMEIMVWSNDLAEVAQEYADNCVFEHNGLRSDQSSSFSYVGENLLITTSGSVNYTAYVESWYNEVNDYDYASNQCSSDADCGHYTQVVWASSNNLGCGVYRCGTVIFNGRTFRNALNVVCNYGPGGNINGRQPYSSSGAVCSECPSDKPFCQSNLCSSSRSSGGANSPGTGTECDAGVTAVQPLSLLFILGTALIVFVLL